MKVWELIALLQQVDPTLEVYTHSLTEDLGVTRMVMVSDKDTAPYFKSGDAHSASNLPPEQRVVYISSDRPQNAPPGAALVAPSLPPVI